VIEHLAGPLDLDVETHTSAFAGALMSDVGVLLSRSRPPGDDAAMVQLGATLLERIAPLSAYRPRGSSQHRAVGRRGHAARVE
jgi:hypothetical protein